MRLYIAREVTMVHSGDIEAGSDDGETVFNVHLSGLAVSTNLRRATGGLRQACLRFMPKYADPFDLSNLRSRWPPGTSALPGALASVDGAMTVPRSPNKGGTLPSSVMPNGGEISLPCSLPHAGLRVTHPDGNGEQHRQIEHQLHARRLGLVADEAMQ